MYMATATHAQFEAKWTQLVTLAGQLERSAQIPFQALIAIGREVQTPLDQSERFASKSPQLEGEHEVIADLVIGYDLAMARHQPKLTADWFTHRTSATHTPATPASKNGPCRSSRTSALRVERTRTNQFSHSNRPPPHPRGTAPFTNLDKVGDRRTAPLRTQAGAGERTPLLSPPPASNPGTTLLPLEAAELAGEEPGEDGRVRVGEGAAAAAEDQCVHSAPTRASQQLTRSQRALSPRATSVANPDTSSATAPTRIHRQTTTAVPG